MAVLLQFNEQKSWTIQQLGENTSEFCVAFRPGCKLANSWFVSLFSAGINQESLIQVLQILLKSKLLTSSDDEANLTTSSSVELNTGFKKYVE